MAEEQQQNALASAFPTPPPFWQSFTPENLERIKALRKAKQQSVGQPKAGTGPATASSNSSAVERLLDLPAELRFLQPPPPPADAKYRCFGDHYNLNEELPSLEDQGIRQLFAPSETPNGDYSDRARYLKQIAKQLLLTFLELVGIMSVNAELYKDKIVELRELFINFHHLLNEYRPHQARESLIRMMEEQLERSRRETEGVLEMKTKVETVLEGLAQVKLEDPDGDGKALNGGPKDDAWGDEAVWVELEKQFG